MTGCVPDISTLLVLSHRVGAVVAARRQRGNVSVQQVFGKMRAIAARRWAIAAGTRRLDHHQRTAGRDEAAFAGEPACVAIRRYQLQLRRRSWLAAGETERWRNGAFAADRRMGLTLQYSPPTTPAQTAAPRAGAAAVGHQRIFLHAQRKAHFDDLDRRVHHVRNGGGDGVDAILHWPRAETTLHGFVADIA